MVPLILVPTAASWKWLSPFWGHGRQSKAWWGGRASLGTEGVSPLLGEAWPGLLSGLCFVLPGPTTSLARGAVLPCCGLVAEKNRVTSAPEPILSQPHHPRPQGSSQGSPARKRLKARLVVLPFTCNSFSSSLPFLTVPQPQMRRIFLCDLAVRHCRSPWDQHVAWGCPKVAIGVLSRDAAPPAPLMVPQHPDWAQCHLAGWGLWSPCGQTVPGPKLVARAKGFVRSLPTELCCPRAGGWAHGSWRD